MAQRPPSVHVLSVGVDWLTATAPADGRDWDLLLSADGALATQIAAGEVEERRKWQRYDLKVCGQVSAGIREDGALVRLSGEAAHEHWRPVAKRAANVSRIDLEVTARVEPPDAKLAAFHLRDAIRWRKRRQHGIKLTYYGTTEGIETVYFGSRASDLFGRIYDKHAESDDERWAGCWRYEVEAKGDFARSLARKLVAEPDPGGAVRVFVHDYFSARGCKPYFARGGGDVSVPIGRSLTTDETRLKWLTESVSPVVTKLTGHGHTRDVMTALGLARGWSRFSTGERSGDGG